MQKIVLIILTTLISSAGWAAGFEKNIMWSGRYAGQAGAAVSTVTGAESLFFNPARLTKGETASDLTANLSPTISQYEAPITTDGQSETSEQTISPIYSVLYRNRFAEGLAVGVGLYLSAGTKVDYKDIALGAVSADFGTSIDVTELSVGVGYDLNEDWSVGAAWRLGMVNAGFKTAGTSGANAALYDFNGMKATATDGFRLSAAYNPSDVWGLGFSWRSRLSIDASGTVDFEVRSLAANTLVTSASSDAEVETELPQQIVLGGHYKFNDMWTGFAEYVMTSYSAIDEIVLDADSGSITDVTIDTSWKDQTNLRLAAEYRGWSLPLRFGYVYTSQVVPKANALPTLSTPDIAHTLTLGTSYKMDEGWWMNAGFEYSTTSGSVEEDGGADPTDGDYSSHAYALHLGMNFDF